MEFREWPERAKSVTARDGRGQILFAFTACLLSLLGNFVFLFMAAEYKREKERKRKRERAGEGQRDMYRLDGSEA